MADILTPETHQTILVIILFYCLNVLVEHLEYISARTAISTSST